MSCLIMVGPDVAGCRSRCARRMPLSMFSLSSVESASASARRFSRRSRGMLKTRLEKAGRHSACWSARGAHARNERTVTRWRSKPWRQLGAMLTLHAPLTAAEQRPTRFAVCWLLAAQSSFEQRRQRPLNGRLRLSDSPQLGRSRHRSPALHPRLVRSRTTAAHCVRLQHQACHLSIAPSRTFSQRRPAAAAWRASVDHLSVYLNCGCTAAQS